MKRPIITIAAFALLYVLSTGYSSGPASGGQGNRTGSPGSAGTCSQGSACHNTPPASATAASFESFFDKTTNSPALPNLYIGGHLYEVTMRGHNGAAGFTQFGFQALAMKTANNTQAGSIIVTASSDHQIANINGLDIIEHRHRIQSPDTNLTVKFDWQAPPPGTGDIRFYGILNAVNGDGDRTGDRHNGGMNYLLHEQPLGVSDVQAGITGIFPNPASQSVHISVAKGTRAAVLMVTDLYGRKVAQQIVDAPEEHVLIDVSSWANGLYIARYARQGTTAMPFLVQH